MNRFFIVGCPRSGTTLLQQILVRHPAVVIPPETAFFTKVVPTSGRVRPGALARLNRDLEIDLRLAGRLDAVELVRAYDAMVEAYVDRIGEPGALYFGEKTPDHLQHGRRIAQLFPEARFLLLHRDGRDVAVSLSRVPWTPSDPIVNFGIWRRAARNQREWMADPPSATLVVRYEDLARTPAAEVARITEFLGIRYDDSLLATDRPSRGIPAWELAWKARATEAIRPNRIGVWRRELTARQVQTMESWGARELTELGYEIGAPADRAVSRLALARTYVRWGAWRATALVRVLAGRA